jgi:2'-5' RNA ligase
MSDGKRLFIGIRVSTSTANQLAQACETLARRARDAGVDIKWIPPISYHVTLKFLGWTRLETIEAIRDRVTQAVAGISRFTFRTARLGAFGSLEKANILWAGCEQLDAFSQLAKAIEGATERLGFAAEKRPYHPHVTLGRLRETRALREVVLPLAEQMFGDTRVDGVTLLESETKPTGSVYRELHRIAFKAAEIAPERQTGAVDLGDETDDGWPRGHGG